MNKLKNININNIVGKTEYTDKHEMIEIVTSDQYQNNNTDYVNPIIQIKNDTTHKIIIRKKQLFDKLDSHKLTYIKGGICDSFIKFGYPTLDQVILDIKEMTLQEEKRLDKLLNALKKNGLKYDSRVSYYKEYIEQGTSIGTALSEGKKEWFYINMTHYLELVKIYKDEDIAQNMALKRYIKKKGHDTYVQKYVYNQNTINMKIELY
jgi:hypothetical protein